MDEVDDVVGQHSLSQVSAGGVEALVDLPACEPRLHDADLRLGDEALRRVRVALL